LQRYRLFIEQSPPPEEHRGVRGVDKRLAAIIDRCLAADPHDRFPTVQTVLAALDARDRHRSHRPLLVLGAVGPILLLAVMTVAAWLWFNTSLNHTDDALTKSALQGLEFASRGVAISAQKELEERFSDVDDVAADQQLVESLASLETNAESAKTLQGLADLQEVKKRQNELIDDLRQYPQLIILQDRLRFFDHLMAAKNTISSSWFITDARGVQVAHWYKSDNTLGHDYAFRTYFTGEGVDRPDDWRPAAGEHLQKTQVSAAYLNSSSDSWAVAISSPIFGLPDASGKKPFLGVVGVSFDLGRELVSLPVSTGHFAVLVYAPDGQSAATVYHHPLMEKLIKDPENKKFPDRFIYQPKYKIPPETLAELSKGTANYNDPIGLDEEGGEYRIRYLAVQTPIEIAGAPTRWLVIVQAPYELAIGATLNQLSGTLVGSGLVALVVFVLIILGLWWLVMQMLTEPSTWQTPATAPRQGIAETLPLEPPMKN
jgi:hypothetical protein